MEEKLIFQKMTSILKETKAITKSEKNQQQGFKFRGIDNVMNELHELFAKNDVFILQEVQEWTTNDRPTKSGGVNTFTRAKIKFRYMNKAMSIALKYSLLQMFLIPTEEPKDPDATTPEETDYIAMALQEINAAQSIQTLSGIFNNYRALQSNPQFMSALSAKKKQLKDGAN